MSVIDAKTARAMAQKIQRAMPGINYDFFDTHPLLKIAKQKGNIKWKGSHTEFEWFTYKNADSAATFGGGELSLNTFEEQDPATRAHMPYSWIQKNYGVSDKTMESNRHSPDRVFKPLEANLKLAKINFYAGMAPAIWSGGLNGNGSNDSPVGLKWAVGDCYEGSSVITVTAGRTYANKTLNTSAIAAYSVDKAGFDEKQWAPEVIDIHEVPNTSSAKWSDHCLIALQYMEDEMTLTHDLTGTGQTQKPDYAFMSRDPYNALKAKATTSQITYNVPAQLVNEDLLLAKWKNIVVGNLTCVKDNNVPADPSTAYERVFVLDSSRFFIATTHTKAEGLIINDFDENNVMINGVVGALKGNMGWYVESPTAIGCVAGCND
jgi:hypothetical protein